MVAQRWELCKQQLSAVKAGKLQKHEPWSKGEPQDFWVYKVSVVKHINSCLIIQIVIKVYLIKTLRNTLLKAF